ncbi:MAG: hypothetical protein IPJ65_15070 [Archangiaceae bacterium]|nr:hypothetical protein [Archangiaceae bacterium]
MGAAAGESGHWDATRLTPPGYPFTVVGVDWLLVANASCNTSITHSVKVFKGTSATPDATPTNVQMTSITPFGSGATIPVHFTLPTPVVLNAGEHLFVAVEMKIVGQQENCLALCVGQPGQADRNWWSNAVGTPYAWTTLASSGIPQNAVVTATGSL